MQLSDDDSTSITKLREGKEKKGNGSRVALAFFCPDGDTKCKRGKRNGVVDRAVNGLVDGVVDPAMFRGFHWGLGLAEGHRGLCRLSPLHYPP